MKKNDLFSPNIQNKLATQTSLKQTKQKMNSIFIWRGIMCGEYTSGIVVASGATKKQAIEKVIQKFTKEQKHTGTWMPEVEQVDISDAEDACKALETDSSPAAIRAMQKAIADCYEKAAREKTTTLEEDAVIALRKELSEATPEVVSLEDLACWQGGGD